MNTMKIITTVWICTMMLIILWSCKGLTWKKDKSSIIGFSFMEIVYIFSLICMWNQTISELIQLVEDTSYTQVVAGSSPVILIRVSFF